MKTGNFRNDWEIVEILREDHRLKASEITEITGIYYLSDKENENRPYLEKKGILYQYDNQQLFH